MIEACNTYNPHIFTDEKQANHFYGPSLLAIFWVAVGAFMLLDVQNSEPIVQTVPYYFFGAGGLTFVINLLVNTKLKEVFRNCCCSSSDLSSRDVELV